MKRLNTQSGKNVIFSGGGAMVNPILQLVAVPILFKRLGAEDFGIWALINAVIASSGIANLGLGDAATKYVAKHRARSEASRVISIIRSIFLLYLVLGAMAAAVVWLAAHWIALHGFKAKSDHLTLAVTSLRIAAVGIVIRFAYGVMESTVRGYDRYDIESVWGTSNAVITTLLAVVCAMSGAGLNVILLVGITVQAVSFAGLAGAVRRLAQTWRFLEPGFDRASMKEVFSFGVFTWLQTLNGIVLQQLDRLVIGASVGAVAVGYYSVCLQLVQTAQTVLSRASAFVFPLIVRYNEEGRKEQLWDLFKQGMILTTVTGWIMSGGIFVFGGNFLALWMGPAFAQRATFPLQILSVWTAFLATSILIFYFLNATGNERLNTLLSASSSFSFLVAGICLIPAFGVVGAAWARLLSFLPALVGVGMVFRRCFNERRWYVSILILIPTTVAVFETMLLHNSRMIYTTGDFFLKIIIFGIACISCAAACCLVYLKVLARPLEPALQKILIEQQLTECPAVRKS